MNTLLTIILSFGKIGLIALGGGNAMLNLLEYEAVTIRHWMEKEEFIRMVGSSFLFPGLTGVKLAALIGYKAAGFSGMLLAVLSLNLPGLILALAGYQWLSTHEGPMIRKIMIAVQYGSVALLAAATWSILEGILNLYVSWPVIIACGLFFLALALLHTSPFWGFLVFIGVCTLLIR